MQITNNSYTFVEHQGDDVWYVTLKEGPYKGVIYRYGAIEVKEDGDHANLKFNFQIAKIPTELDMDVEDLNNDYEFCTHLGDVLTHIIEDSLETGKFKLGNNDKPTDSESTVH